MKTQSELHILTHQSRLLQGNPLGDPTERKLYLYTPPGYHPGTPLPALLALTGFGGTGAMLFNADPFSEDLKSRLDRLILSGQCPPALVVAPDCFTRLGGNQYINSSATGPYQDYLTQEILPFVESRFAVSRWGAFGKSSGGYGSLMLAMDHGDRIQAVASHSADCHFELCYLPDLAKALNALSRAGGPKMWLEKFWADVNRHRGEYHAVLNTLAMAAHYSPNPQAELGLELPYDYKTGVLRQDIWERWRAWDPIHRAEHCLNHLKKLRLLYLDCGSRDEFGLQWGARALGTKLTELGIAHERQEFDDGHRSITYRFDVSLPKLVRALSRE